MARYPIADARSVIDSLESSTIFSGIDMKSGFHNIPVSERAADVLGLVTQDGLFRYLTMPFGPMLAPFYF